MQKLRRQASSLNVTIQCLRLPQDPAKFANRNMPTSGWCDEFPQPEHSKLEYEDKESEGSFERQSSQSSATAAINCQGCSGRKISRGGAQTLARAENGAKTGSQSLQTGKKGGEAVAKRRQDSSEINQRYAQKGDGSEKSETPEAGSSLAEELSHSQARHTCCGRSIHCQAADSGFDSVGTVLSARLTRFSARCAASACAGRTLASNSR